MLDERAWAIDELVAALDAEGLIEPLGVPADRVASWLLSQLADQDGVWISQHRVVAKLDVVLSGSVFTHRVTQAELDAGMLDAHPDFAVLAWDEVDALRLGDGLLDVTEAAIDEGAAEAGSLVGPDGWLDGLEPGDLVAVWRVGHEARLERIDEPASDADEVRALRQAFGFDVEDGHDEDDAVAETVADLVVDAMCENAAIFRRPVRPLAELLADAGLSYEGEWCGPAGADWVPPAIADEMDDFEYITSRYDLDECCLESIDDAMAAWNALVTATDAAAATDAIDWARVADALGHGEVAAAFADIVLRDRDEPPALYDDFIGALTQRAPRSAAITGYLTARKFELLGETLLAESALHAATQGDPHFAPAVEDLAWYVADRGDADRAVQLLRRVGLDDDHPEVSYLESMRPRRNVVGRNERCPCGSGRKYKDCCARNPRLPLVERVDWLHHKLWRFAMRPQREDILIGITAVASLNGANFEDVIESGVPFDLAAFDAGIATEFLAQRGVLLPDDERELLASWVAQPRALYEVVDVAVDDSGECTLTLCDTRDSSMVTVSELVDEDDAYAPGDLVYARVVDIAGRHEFIGVPLTADAERRSSLESLAASDPTEVQLAMWLTGMEPPEK